MQKNVIIVNLYIQNYTSVFRFKVCLMGYLKEERVSFYLEKQRGEGVEVAYYAS